MGFVKTININFTDNLPTFPITKSLWSYLKLLLICLLELGFGFHQSLPQGQPVGKLLYYRSFDRSANWRVKDSILLTSNPGSALVAHKILATQKSELVKYLKTTFSPHVRLHAHNLRYQKQNRFWIGWFQILTAQVDSSTCQLRKMISQTFGPVGDSSAEELVWNLTASSQLLYDYYI